MPSHATRWQQFQRLHKRLWLISSENESSHRGGVESGLAAELMTSGPARVLSPRPHTAAESSNVRIKKSALMSSSRDLYVCSCLPGTFYLGPVEEKVESLLRERNNVLSICHFRFTWPKDAFPSCIVNKVWNSLTSTCRQAILWSYHRPRESSWDPNAQYQLLGRPDWTQNIFSALTSPTSWTYRE